MDSIGVIEIKQIYNFIAENPIILNSNNINRVKKFIEEYYFGSKAEINISEAENSLNIKFYDNETINFDVRSLPNFLHREEFIRWCESFLLIRNY